MRKARPGVVAGPCPHFRRSSVSLFRQPVGVCGKISNPTPPHGFDGGRGGGRRQKRHFSYAPHAPLAFIKIDRDSAPCTTSNMPFPDSAISGHFRPFPAQNPPPGNDNSIPFHAVAFAKVHRHAPPGPAVPNHQKNEENGFPVSSFLKQRRPLRFAWG